MTVSDHEALLVLPSTVMVTEYTFLPPGLEDDPERFDWSLRVVWRDKDRWAVLRRGYVYDADGHEEYESSPSNRTDEFKARFRHSLPAALVLAERLMPTLTVNGWTAEQWLTHTRSRRRRDL